MNAVAAVNATTVSPLAEKIDRKLNLILIICCVFPAEISDVLNFAEGALLLK